MKYSQVIHEIIVDILMQNALKNWLFAEAAQEGGIKGHLTPH